MTVTKTPSAATVPGTQWLYLSGTIQEVLDELSSQSASALNMAYWSDDGTDAKALFCKQE